MPFPLSKIPCNGALVYLTISVKPKNIKIRVLLQVEKKKTNPIRCLTRQSRNPKYFIPNHRKFIFHEPVIEKAVYIFMWTKKCLSKLARFQNTRTMGKKKKIHFPCNKKRVEIIKI